MNEQLNLDEPAEPQPRPGMDGAGGRAGQPRSTEYGSQEDAIGGGEVHLLDYVKVLYKRRWTAVTALLIVVMGVSVYTFTATPIYQARVQILIEKEATNVVSFKQAFEQNQTTDDYYQTQYKVLQSRALARRTLDALKLWNDPQFNPKPDDSLTIGKVIRAPFALVAGWFQAPGSSEPPPVEETATQSATIDRFLRGLTVTPIRNSRLVDVKYDSTNAALSAQVSNALARAYIEQNLEFKFLSSKEASDWLGHGIADATLRLGDGGHAAGDGGDRCGRRGAPCHRRAVRRRR